MIRCPFCGETNVHPAFGSGDPYRSMFVRCVDCGATGPKAATIGEAIGKWNERAIQQADIAK